MFDQLEFFQKPILTTDITDQIIILMFGKCNVKAEDY